MDCKRTLELLPAHLDQELGLPESSEMNQHLQTCPACHNAFVNQSALRDAVKQHATYFQAPGDLESRIRAALPLEHETPTAPAKRRPWRWGSWNWFNAGTLLASLIALVWSAGLYLATPSPNQLLAEEVLSSHVQFAINQVEWVVHLFKIMKQKVTSLFKRFLPSNYKSSHLVLCQLLDSLL